MKPQRRELLKPEEKVESIVRVATREEDEDTIRYWLNRSIKRGTGIVGGGIKRFEPFAFHEDEPREVCVYTIPYLLDDQAPVLRELVNMLWSTVDASKDLSKIDRYFINQTQRLLDDFNSQCKVSASYIDLYRAIESFMVEKGSSRDEEKTRSSMKSLIDRVSEKWKEYRKPVVCENVTAMNLLLKLYRCIDREEYKESIDPLKFYNVFVMAYDTGADNRWFFTRWFARERSTLESCVAFTSIDGLLSASVSDELSFEPEYKSLHDKIEEEITRYLISIQTMHIPEEQSKLHELWESLDEMSLYMKRMLNRDAINDAETAEGKHILKRINESMNRITGGDGGSEENLDEETKKLRKHVEEMKSHLAEQENAINSLIEFRDDTLKQQKALVKARTVWEKRAVEIDGLVNSLRRDEEHLEAIAKDASRKLISQQIEQADVFGRWILRQIFPSFFDEKKKK